MWATRSTYDYELKFPETSAIHPVTSVSHLSAAPEGKDPFDRAVPPPGPVEAERSDSEDSGESYEVEVVLDHQPYKDGFQYLIKWVGYGHHWNIWRTERQMRHSMPLVEDYWKRKESRAERAPSAKTPEMEELSRGTLWAAYFLLVPRALAFCTFCRAPPPLEGCHKAALPATYRVMESSFHSTTFLTYCL